jgi:hypothetical protein
MDASITVSCKNGSIPMAEPELETRRSGIFGWSYDRR